MTEPAGGAGAGADVHWFTRPGVIDADHPGLMNPVYELLDIPIVQGNADHPFLTATNCYGVDVTLTFAEALDRVAKVGGLLKLMDVGPGTVVEIAPDVPALAAQLVRLGTWRVGGCVVDGQGSVASVAGSVGTGAEVGSPSAPTVCVVAGQVPALSAEQRGVHQAFSKPVKALPSHFEGAVALFEDKEFVLDSVVRDARVEPAVAAELPADLGLVCGEHPRTARECANPA